MLVFQWQKIFTILDDSPEQFLGVGIAIDFWRLLPRHFKGFGITNSIDWNHHNRDSLQSRNSKRSSLMIETVVSRSAAKTRMVNAGALIIGFPRVAED